MREDPAAGAATAMREERKVVTALFADLVGSTALAERLDPEEVRLVVGEAVARMVSEVGRFGGHVKDLAGDGVLALFGAPVSYEDDPERAVRAGLAIVRELADYADEVDRSFGIGGFGVRIGLATGPVVLGPVGSGTRVEYAAFGDTVNIAARLQAAAKPSSVLVEARTQRQVAALFDWADPCQLEVKGKAERVTAYEVRRTLAGARALQMRAELVGRERELRAAREALVRVLEGAGGILYVTGEAGIGKSRLLAELRGGAGTATWLEGRCVSYGESLPLWPFRDLLREWVGMGADEPELRVRVALRRSIEVLFGERTLEIYPYLGSLLGLTLEADAAARLAELSPEALQYRTFEVMGTLLARLSERGPVVVALEDLHWADPTSVQLVEALFAVCERSPVLLIAVQRDDRDHRSWTAKEAAAREFPHLVREVALEPLSGDAPGELLDGLVGAETLPAHLRNAVLEACEGNPFYLEELVGSLTDAGALVRGDAGWRFDHDVPVEVPETVEKAILARIDRLSPECHGVVTAASALGRRFGLELLEGVVEGDGSVREALHELQRLDLLRTSRQWPEPEYRFKHALIQEATYRTLLSEPRARLHRRAAEWLERRHADNLDEVLGLLAHHWLAAEDDEKAIDYLTRAGDRARGEWALDEAIGHYRALLPLLERRGEHQEMALVLFKLALALHTALRFSDANEAYARAFELWSPPEPRTPTATLRLATTAVPVEPDPPRSYSPTDIQLQMALFDRLVERWPEATIVPSLAERWEISDDGLRYVFHLREGLRWSDGTPLTAADVEYGIKRNLDRDRPGVSVAMLFALENAQDYLLGRNDDLEAVGVRAVGDRTVEFRLTAPAPYFLSLVNRPDAGPQPRHAIDRYGDEWTLPDRQVVSGAFRPTEATEAQVVLARREDSARRSGGNVRRVELVRSSFAEMLEANARSEIDVAAPRISYDPSELVLSMGDEIRLEPPAWLFYLMLDHGHPDVARLELRRALAHAIDREELATVLAPNFVIATGGMVPPILQGHTPDIAPIFDPELAHSLFERSGASGALGVAVPRATEHERLTTAVARMWERTLGLSVQLRVIDVSHWGEPDEPVVPSGWFPGYPDPEYYLRLLLHSEAKDNAGRFRHAPFDDLIERARRERDGRRRLELFHEADRMAVADQVAVIPLAYGRNVTLVKPWVHGWWEFGKSWSSFADLVVDETSPRYDGSA